MIPRLSCREFTEFLAEYLDRTLPEDAAVRFDAHLAACPACTSFLGSYRETVRLGRLAAGEEIPSDAPEELVLAILAVRGAV